MRKKIIVYVSDKDGYKIKLKWFWKRLWKVLTEEEQEKLNSVFDEMYKNYCKYLQEMKKHHT